MTKNNKESKGTKGTKQKTTNPVEKKGHGEEVAILKLMNDTKKKLSVLAKDIVTVPRKNTIGWKFGSKLLIAMGARKTSFYMWIYEYSEKSGARKTIEAFQIKSTGKESEKVVEGLIKQVRKNYDILTAAKAKKAEPKKETFAEATIVEEIPIEEALKEDKKKEVAAST